jgi:hypothetical protein
MNKPGYCFECGKYTLHAQWFDNKPLCEVCFADKLLIVKWRKQLIDRSRDNVTLDGKQAVVSGSRLAFAALNTETGLQAEIPWDILENRLNQGSADFKY